MEQIGEGHADRLAGVSFVIEKAGRWVYLKAVVLTVGSFLEVNPGQQKIHFACQQEADSGT